MMCGAMAILPNVSDVWRRDPPWAAIYSSGVGNEPLARVVGRVFWGTDVGLLYRAASVIGEQPDGAAVLDVPCGGGVALRGLRREQRVRYVAADIAEAMLERTGREAERRGLRQVELRRADVEELPFADGEFDLCVSFTGLHCFPHPRRAIGELGRVVRPGRPPQRQRRPHRRRPALRAHARRRPRGPAHGPEPQRLAGDTLAARRRFRGRAARALRRAGLPDRPPGG